MHQIAGSAGDAGALRREADATVRRVAVCVLAAMVLLLALTLVPGPQTTGAVAWAAYATSLALVVLGLSGAAVASLGWLRPGRRSSAAAPDLGAHAGDEGFRPVALKGGMSLHVCGHCLTVVEGDLDAMTASCPSCGRHAVRPRRSGSMQRQASQPAGASTRVVLLSGGLDERSLARLETAVLRRAEEPRRVVVLQISPGETASSGALRTLRRAQASAAAAGGHLVLSSPDAPVREALRTLDGVIIAATTSQAMELAADLGPTEAAAGAERRREAVR